MTKHLVSVIVPTYSSEKTIASCLKSIKSQKYLKEIIVVDNFSTDETIKIVKKLTTYVYQKGPERSAQRNFGAQKAKSEWLLFVDSDQELSKNCLTDALETAALDAVIIPELVKGDSYWSRCLNLEKQIYTNDQTVSAARLIKRSIFLKAGGFDEKLIAAEDWDLHQRLIDRGSKIGFSKSPIYNMEQNSTLSSIIKKKYYYSQNIHKYAAKNPQLFKKQVGLTRLFILFSKPKLIFKNPVEFLGLLILKFAQYFAFVLVFVKIRKS